MNEITYNRNMIEKFIFRLDFISEIEELKENIPHELNEKIVCNFPNSKSVDVVESQIKMNKDNIEKKDRPFKQWEYISADMSNQIIITSESIVYDCNSYTSFSDVLSKFLDIVEKILEYKNVQIKRIGLRYINLYKSDDFNIKKTEDWEKYFSEDLFRYLHFGNNLENVTNLVNMIEFSKGTFRLRLKSGFNNKNYPLPLALPDYTLDFDGYTNVIIDTISDFKEMINSIHKEIESTFKLCINSEMEKKLNE